MLSDRLKMLRESNGFTQDEVAKALGLNRTTYTYYETGRHEPKIETLRAISKIFKVDVAFLIGDEMGVISSSYVLNDNSEKYDTGINVVTPKLTKDEKMLLLYYRQLDDAKKARLVRGIKEKIQY